MHGIQKIEDRLTAARARLLATMDRLDEAAWEWRPGDGRWSVRLTLVHVVSAQWNHLEVARRFVAGERVDIPGFDLDAWNATMVAERADWSVDQVLTELEAAHQATLAFLSSLDAEKLATVGTHPALGQMSVAQVLRVIGLHDNMHRRDVLRLLDEMSAGRQRFDT